MQDATLFPYSEVVQHFSNNYLQKLQPNQPVLLDNSGKQELDLLIYEAGFREKRDNLPEIHCRQKKCLYELLIETNIFEPEWGEAKKLSGIEEKAKSDLEDTVHGSTMYPHEFSYLSFPSENDRNKFLEYYSSMKSLECQKLGDAKSGLAFEKSGNIRKLYRIGSAAMAICDMIPLLYIISHGVDNIPIVLAGTGLTLGAAGFWIAGDYSYRKRVGDAENELCRIMGQIEQSRFVIEQYRPITLLNKEALEKALEIK